MSRKSIVLMISALLLMQIFLFASTQMRSGRPSDGQVKSDGSVASASSVSLLRTPVRLEGAKTLAEMNLSLPPATIGSRNTIKVSYDLHGLCLLGGPASLIAFQNLDRVIRTLSLASAGKNCHDGKQSIDIPLDISAEESADGSGVDMHISIWYPTTFSVEITAVVAYNAGSAVLGVNTQEAAPLLRKSFDRITPIRTEPYARADDERE